MDDENIKCQGKDGKLLFGVIGQKELVTSPNNSEIQMTCEALPIPQNLPM